MLLDQILASCVRAVAVCWVAQTVWVKAATLEARCNMCRVLILTVVCATTIAISFASAQSALSRYRGVTLGDAVQVVVSQLNMTSSDVKVVHERPTLIQRITWRPRRLVSGTVVEPDAVSEVVLTFHLGLLAGISAIYDLDRTKGLTNADLHEAFTNIYGTSLLIPTPPRTTAASRAETEIIGRWDDAETLVLLWREPSTNRIKLTVTSIATDRALQQAIADGLRLEASEAPARDLARRATEDAAIRARDEKERSDNKATFKP